MSLPTFSSGFEYYLHRAMYANLRKHGFRGSKEPGTIEQSRREIHSNFRLLETCGPELQDEIMSRALFPLVYEPGLANRQVYEDVMWVKRNKALDYSSIVEHGILIVKQLVRDPEMRNDTEVRSGISYVTELMTMLVASRTGVPPSSRLRTGR